MGNLKKRLSSVLAMLLTAFTCLSSVPAKAAETTPEVTFVGVEHSPLVVGDTEVFYVSSVGAEKVQYRIFQNKIGTDKWEELTKGYTEAVNANEIASINALAKYEAGKYKLSIWVKKADEKGKFQNKKGDYDSYYITYLNCVNKDNNNRVYTNGDMNIEKDNYVVGETVKISGIKDVSGMEGPYTYKLHIYDANSNEWKFDKEAYRKDLSFVADKAGTYVLDVWAMSSNSTLWAKEAKLNGRIYEAWKLKVIRVTEKVEEPEVNVTENNEIFGSEDAKKPMEINKNVNITGKNVAFNNVNVKGNIIVTGDYTTLNNVKIEGTLVLNPGEKGTANLNNVTADTIEVLSGATNSIHFNNVSAKVINVKSKNAKEIVRIELKGNSKIERTDVKSSVILEAIEGSFGNVQILENENKAESFIELRGTFDKDITIKTKATLKAAKDAKVSKVIVEPANNEKITFDGNFNEVELNKLCTLITTSNSTIAKVITNSPATLELGKGSIVATLDQKGQVVTQTGTGTIQKKINPPTVPTSPSTGGGSGGGSGGGTSGGEEKPTPTPTVTDDIFYNIVKLANNQPAFVETLGVEYNKQTSTLNVKVKKPQMSLGGVFALKENRKPLDGSDMVTLLSLYTSIVSPDVKLNGKAMNQIVNEILLDPKFAGKSFMDVLKGLTYDELIMLINSREEFKSDQMTLSIGNDSLTSINVNGVIYGGTDKHISREELRNAFGITGKLSNATLDKFKGKTIVIAIGAKNYTIVISN